MNRGRKGWDTKCYWQRVRWWARWRRPEQPAALDPRYSRYEISGDIEDTPNVLWTSESPIFDIRNIGDDDVYPRRAVRMWIPDIRDTKYRGLGCVCSMCRRDLNPRYSRYRISGDVMCPSICCGVVNPRYLTFKISGVHRRWVIHVAQVYIFNI